MKVQMVTREPKSGVFVVSRPVELAEMAAVAGQVQANAGKALAEGLIEIVGSEGSLGRLFPVGEQGMVVAMYLSQEELQAKRAAGGLAELLRGGGTWARRVKSKRKRR